LFLGAGVIAPLAAQSLADLARQEAARRKAIKQPSKVFTNKDLGAVPATPPPPATPKPAGVAATAAEAGKDADKDQGDQQDADRKAGELPPKTKDQDQASWSARVKELQVQLDRDQTYAEALQTRINGLTTDFVNRDDPAQRAVIANDRQKALDALDRLTTQIEADKKAITDFQEDARRAGIPPGWLR